MHQWFQDINNVIQLAEFLVDSGEITSVNDLLDYFRDPSRFTDVWILFKTEILGEQLPIIQIR